jgi:signal transduction histidine kinase
LVTVPADAGVYPLLVPVEPITPAHTINDASELLLQPSFQRFLCLPVVHNGVPVGTVSRDRLQRIYMSLYGRDLFGRKPVTQVMNPKPLVVELQTALDQASQYVTRNISFPITEDILLTEDGRYRGVGHVLDLLQAMEQQLADRNREVDLAYHKLKSSQTQLVQAEKMASLGQMVAGVAHEINTPLGYVQNNVDLACQIVNQMRNLVQAFEGMTDLLASGEAGEEEVKTYLDTIAVLRGQFNGSYAPEDIENLFGDTLYGLRQISEIVLNLKNFSRLDQAPVDNVNLNECLESVLLIARNVLKHKAEVVRDYGELPPVSCSPSQINQVFLNLLTNAAHAIQGQGRILLKTRSDERHVHVVVGDNGRGIAKENLKKIFDPFFTTKPAGEGTGLGLSIAYQIVNAHQGHIRVNSQLGVGTRFCVSLPRERARD